MTPRPDRDWLLANGYDENGNRRGIYGSSGTHRPLDTRGDGSQGFRFAFSCLRMLARAFVWSWKKLGPLPTVGITAALVILIAIVLN